MQSLWVIVIFNRVRKLYRWSKLDKILILGSYSITFIIESSVAYLTSKILEISFKILRMYFIKKLYYSFNIINIIKIS